MTQDIHIRPVIISGGSGTRMWPLSRKAHPKQFHKLLADKSFFQLTAERVSPRHDAVFSAPIILASQKHERLIEQELSSLGVQAHLSILEPLAKNTAPAIAAVAVACEKSSPGEILVVLPADQIISDTRGFAEALKKGAPQAAAGKIVTFGITPDRPETGYGYIQCGEQLDEHTNVVAAFKEKPDLETAQTYIKSGDYLWNGGIFMFRSDVMIDELKKRRPAMADCVTKAVDNGKISERQLLLDEGWFSQAEEDSIDYAVMEHTDRAAVVAVNVGWSDVGSWASLWEVSQKDEAGNVGPDESIFLNTKDTLVVSDGPLVATIGVTDLLIIATADGLLVAQKDSAQDVKKVVKHLKDAGKTNLL